MYLYLSIPTFKYIYVFVSLHIVCIYKKNLYSYIYKNYIVLQMYFFIKVHRTNHRTIWVGKGVKDHGVPTSLL